MQRNQNGCNSLLVSRTLSIGFFSKKRRVSGVGVTQQNQRVGIIAMLQLHAVHVLLLAFSRNQLLRKQSWKFALSRPLHVHFRFVFIRAVFPDLLPWPQVRLPRSKFCRVLILLYHSCVRSMSCMNMNSRFFFVLLFVFFSVFSLVLSLLKQDLQDSKELNKKRNKEPVQV